MMHPSSVGLRSAPVALLLLALLAPEIGACRRTPGDQSSQPAQAASSTRENAKLASLVERLADSDEARREAASKELDEVAKRGVSASEGAFLLRAAAGKYPDKKYRLGSTQSDLIRAAESNPDVSYVPIVKQVFPALEAPTKGLGDPRTEALALLANIDDEAGARALLELLEGAVASGSPPPLRMTELEKKPKFAQVYFPRLLKSATGPAAFGVFSLCLAYATKRAVAPAQLAPHAGVVVRAYQSMRPTIAAAQARPGTDWMWDDDYGEVREDAGLVLDLMGYFPSADVEATLDDASRLQDARLAGFAVGSLLRLRGSVEAAVLERVAANPQMRDWLFDELGRQGKRQLFPAQWATQKAFAEADMVSWLIYPTELGRAPDEIELMKVVSEDFGPPDGVMDWYLFRFRTKPPHWSAKDGWMAGIAGPFKRSEEPSTRSYGDTFSTFTPWDSKTPEQHVADVREVMQQSRAHRRGEAK
jgi:hypothetical protein